MQATIDLDNNASARSAHRVLQSRVDRAKTGAHRYERRKVREFLRNAGLEDGSDR